MPAKKPKIIVPCATCGAMLERHPYRLTYAKNQFCDAKCHGAWNTTHNNGENHPRWVKELAVRCDQCGKEFRQKARSRLARNQHNFCCDDCARLWMVENDVYVGENNHNWKGGEVDYYGPNWFRQARAARQRDGYKCRHCGKSQKKTKRTLDVHHIVPFRNFGYIRDRNDNYLQANDLSNLITLCQQCHAKAEVKLIPIQPNLLSA